MPPEPINEAQRVALKTEVETAVETSIRPTLEAEGSEIEVVGVDEDRIVQIRLNGACQSCSSSVISLTFDIEKTLKALVPEVRFVEAVP